MAERDVFINCPFDAGYQPLFVAIVFTVIRSGLRPRSALEDDDAGENRLAKIMKIIGECPFGIHDISRTETSGTPALPRFNMPLELGIYLGAKTYGGKRMKEKRALILDREEHRYQRFVSDLAGQDIKAHADDPAKAIARVADWLRNHSGFDGIPGGRKIAGEYAAFQEVLPALCEAQDLDVAELGFNDYVAMITAYVALPA